ncbi:MAG: hypothetical protein IIA17_11045 [candidate division Zixibacteria bacterium]|nr:hypothetical protein [candidate division Zixibacteria bacterium]
MEEVTKKSEETKEEIKQEVELEENSNLPKYMSYTNDGNLLIKTKKDGNFILTDVEFEKIEKARSRATMGRKKPDAQKVQRSILTEMVTREGEDKRISDDELGKIKFSTMTRLSRGLKIILDEEEDSDGDFL